MSKSTLISNNFTLGSSQFAHKGLIFYFKISFEAINEKNALVEYALFEVQQINRQLQVATP